jgi:AbrB family looped-hinge helix DNA binding protein
MPFWGMSMRQSRIVGKSELTRGAGGFVAMPAAKAEPQPRVTARVKVRPKAQLTLPEEIRSALHIGEGDEVEFAVQQDWTVTVRGYSCRRSRRCPAASETGRTSRGSSKLPREFITEYFVPDLAAPDRPFRPGLRVKGVTAHPGVFEMTWDSNGRATFSYGEERIAGQTHVIWRRIGTHTICTPPPGP